MEKKSNEEKEAVKKAKAQYQSNMKAYFGSSWKTKSRALGFNNVPNL